MWVFAVAWPLPPGHQSHSWDPLKHRLRNNRKAELQNKPCAEHSTLLEMAAMLLYATATRSCAKSAVGKP